MQFDQTNWIVLNSLISDNPWPSNMRYLRVGITQISLLYSSVIIGTKVWEKRDLRGSLARIL